MYYVNEREIRVVGLMRSGHHAVIQWIAGHFDASKLCILNDCHPYSSPHHVDAASELNSNTFKQWDRAKERALGWKVKDAIIYNYEDRNLNHVFDPEFDSLKSMFIGPSLLEKNILVLRDPFNCFASRLKWFMKLHSPAIPQLTTTLGRKLLVERWKQYAKEYLGHTSIIPNKVIVDYNKWFVDQSYREGISAQLNVKFNDRWKNKISKIGKSSFDGDSFENNADRMLVLERWRQYQHHPVFVELTSDKELIELCNEIYGKDFRS